VTISEEVEADERILTEEPEMLPAATAESAASAVAASSKADATEKAKTLTAFPVK
jgi:hypothetical protein